MRMYLTLLVVTMIALTGGCKTYGGSANTLPEDVNGNFHLQIHNTKFTVEPETIKVFLDGKEAANRWYGGAKGHSEKRFQFYLAPGAHVLLAKRGSIEQEFPFEVTNQVYGVLTFSPEKQFEFQVSDEPIYVPGNKMVYK